ncbi:PREDICTED: putative late blight resistance protein homolog R1A-3 [Ipomoea nil]|uniref:putative late blight resistance protein homolog R1A-3 n=1 Tax=Ipomoea nil TaxID=35883 RepID=UPI000900B89A|nr:PREDICTED: putative late blight resistance protein homolog R1A-3 [Ipomoea nil]
MAVEDALSISGRVDRLEQLAEENRLFEMGIKSQISDLVIGLKSLSSTVELASENERAKYALKDMVEKIRNVISDAEHAICMFTVERKKHARSEAKCIRDFSEEIQSITDRVKKIKEDHAQTVKLLICHTPITDAVVGELVSRLAQAVEENASLIIGIKDQIEDLVSDLTTINAYLKQASESQSAGDNEVLNDVVKKIRNVVIEAEDAIGKFTVERKKYKDKGVLRYLETLAYFAKVNVSAREIQSIRDKVQKIRQDNAGALRALIGPPIMQRMAPVVEEEDVVGFDDEAKFIKGRLLGGSTDLEFISIKGMAGLGKTTLAKMVFKDRDLQFEFFNRLWVYVSRTFNRKQIFLDILSNFTKKTKEFHDMSEESIAVRIQEFLVGGKYFIVMDSVWLVNDWECLKIAFPNNSKGSRVLMTTRFENVALHVDSTSNPHQLKFLANHESWELLEKKVFRKEKCPQMLKVLGNQIAIKCNGLPLAVVVIAGVLNKDSTHGHWKQVAENPFPVINPENQSYNKLVKLSYNYLPYYSKDCFLYLAAFPIGHEIASWKLIRSWIAEGFIPLMEGGYTSDLERTAEKYLEDLADRNLLMVLKRRADGQIKTCRIHDTLHEFCKNEAATKNFFHEMYNAKLDVNKIPRRLCVHSSILEFLKLDNKPSSEHVRSFLSYCSKEVEIPNECLGAIPKSFPLLRVMDVEYLIFKILPKEFYNLYHLRFLAVSTDMKLLPKLFSNLCNMQTLVFNSSQNSLEVKADIWSMSKLRHVHSNSSMLLPPPPKSSKNNASVSTDIKTLSTISPSSCTGDIFDKTPDLQKLGIRGNLAELMDVKQGGVSLFDNLHKLDRLENLKLINDAVQSNKLRSFPHAEKFPRRLRKMTLSNTAFKWKDLSALESLDELEVLKLEDNAFRGKFCDVRSVVFKQLQYFRIQSSDLVSWTASKDSFPVLKCLFLRNCTKLEAVPVEFGEIESLKLLELYCTNKGAVNSAQKIQELKRGVNGDTKKGGFQLSIYPPKQLGFPRGDKLQVVRQSLVQKEFSSPLIS